MSQNLWYPFRFPGSPGELSALVNLLHLQNRANFGT